MSKENKNINIGDKVRHKTFGQGMIVAKTKKEMIMKLLFLLTREE